MLRMLWGGGPRALRSETRSAAARAGTSPAIARAGRLRCRCRCSWAFARSSSSFSGGKGRRCFSRALEAACRQRLEQTRASLRRPVGSGSPHRAHESEAFPAPPAGAATSSDPAADPRDVSRVLPSAASGRQACPHKRPGDLGLDCAEPKWPTMLPLTRIRGSGSLPGLLLGVRALLVQKPV